MSSFTKSVSMGQDGDLKPIEGFYRIFTICSLNIPGDLSIIKVCNLVVVV